MKEEVRVKVDGETERVLDRIIDAIELRLQALDGLDGLESRFSQVITDGVDDFKNGQAQIAESLMSELKNMKDKVSSQNDNLHKQNEILSVVKSLADEVVKKADVIEAHGTSLIDKLSNVSSQIESLETKQVELPNIRSKVDGLVPLLSEKLGSIETIRTEMNNSMQQVLISLSEMQREMEYLSQPWWRRLFGKGR